MSTIRLLALSTLFVGTLSCAAQEGAPAATPAAGGQASVSDDVSTPNVVRVAVGSKDHTTLVAALQAADLVNSLANAGPFTVFAPTNAAFDKLPKGTVDDLLKPANKPTLVNILYHHVTTSALGVEALNEGTNLMMVDGTAEPITKKGNDLYVGGAKILASVRASNGWVHVVDAVLVPAGKK
jgi:uncharacterized surface protein with fasciclin (FAS1) repeats